MSRTAKAKRKPASAEAIARAADAGEDVSRHFTNRGRMMPAIQRVNVDFNSKMLAELDEASRELNVSRQAVIKVLLRQALDQHYVAVKARKSG
jgi:hypothetical protein